MKVRIDKLSHTHFKNTLGTFSELIQSFSSVSIIRVNFLMVTLFIGFAEFVCAYIYINTGSKNTEDSSHLEAENCEQVGEVLSSRSIVENKILTFPLFSVMILEK